MPIASVTGWGTRPVEGARPATPDDVAVIAALVAEAVAEQAPLRGGAVFTAREARALPAESSLAAAVDDERQLLVAGTFDDVIVGYTAVRLDELRTGTVLGVIDDIYVDPGARGVGVGEAMVDLVLEWCRSHGCAGVDGMALPGNRDTKNFFETFGFTARAIVVHKSLAAEEPAVAEDAAC